MKGIELDHVTFSYDGINRVLDEISLKIQKGSFTAVSGANGSGKSTFAYLLNGLIPHQINGRLEGKVLIDGANTLVTPARTLSRKVGLLFQNPDFSLFQLTIREELEFGLRNFKIPYDDNVLLKALTECGLNKDILSDPQSLSIGEKQKLSLASLLLLSNEYLVLDEPVSFLDYKSTVSFYETLRKLHKAGRTIITIEHDSDLIYRYADESVILSNGRVLAMGRTKQLFSDKELLRKANLKFPNKQ